jgi:predicted dehydrogenase
MREQGQGAGAPRAAADGPVRWGVAGPGLIAALVAEDFPLVDDASLVAVAARSPERARAFAGRFGVARAHGSYGELCRDPEVDAVYVATTHPHHHAIALDALANGKHVLVEKPFTATLAGTREVVAEARARGLFCMEAMWTRFLPAIARLREMVAAGAIGDVVAVTADFGMKRAFDATHRLFDVETAGGALLDLGVYPVSFAHMLLGAPATVTAVGDRAVNGVEISATLLLGWDRGRAATLGATLRSEPPNDARVLGTEGWIDVPAPFHRATHLVVHRPGDAPEHFDDPIPGGGWHYELAEATRCIRAGRTESAVMPLDHTIEVMEVLELAAAQLGVTWRESPATSSHGGVRTQAHSG